MRRAGSLSVLVVVVATSWYASVPARAHEELALHALPVITSVTPQIEGLRFRVLQLTAPALVVENETNRALTVPDEEGNPFLRIGPRGVDVNAQSPLTYRSFDPEGHGAVPPDLRPDGRARWVSLSKRPTWTWFDPRLEFDPNDHNWALESSIDGGAVMVSGTYEPLQGHGHFETRIARTPRIDGLDLRVVEGPVPGIFVRNDSGRTLRVPGRSGEPFLRVGPRGVWANLRSPSWYLGGSQAVSRVPKAADPDAQPVWKKVSSQPVWSWLEYRAALPFEMHERANLGALPADVLSWSTPLSLGDRPLALQGIVRWIPPRSTSLPSPWWPRLAGVAGLSVAAVGLLRIRRRAA